MFFKEIVVQGVFGVAKGVRLPLGEGLTEPLLPPPLDTTRFKKIITMLLYPHTSLRSGAIDVDLQVPYPVRLGAVMDIGGLEYKVIWQLKEDSLQVLSSGAGSAPVATNAEQAQALWQKLLGLLPFDYFTLLHFHEFTDPSQEEAPRDEASKLVLEYRRAITVERIERAMDNLEGELRDLQQAKNPALKVEGALERLNRQLESLEALPDLSPAHLDFLSGYDDRMARSQREFKEISNQIESVSDHRTRIEPGSMLSNRMVSGGVFFGLGAVVAGYFLASYNPHFRAIALLDMMGFGAAAFGMVKHLTLRGQEEILTNRMSQLSGRMDEVTRAMEREKTQLKSLLKRYEASSAQQIVEDLQSRDTLRKKRQKLESRLKEHLDDPIYVKQRREIQSLKDKIAPLKEKRKQFGDFVMPSYELKIELEERGVHVESLQPLDAQPESPLIELAQMLKYIPSDSEIPSNLLGVFNRLVSAVVGVQNALLSIEEGQLVVTIDRQTGCPLRKHSHREQLAFLRAIALSILLQHHQDTAESSDHASFLILDDPWKGMQRAERVRYYSLLKEFARDFQVIIPKAGS